MFNLVDQYLSITPFMVLYLNKMFDKWTEAKCLDMKALTLKQLSGSHLAAVLSLS